MTDLKYEIRKITNDDLSISPKWFQTDAENPNLLYRHLNWMMFYLEDDTNPYYYMRNNEVDKYRWGGIVRLGDGPLMPQTSVHYDDLAQKNTPVRPYARISENPIIYSSGTTNPFSELTYMEEYAVFKEENILDFKCEYWPFAIFAHTGSMWNGEYLYQPFSLTGTYEGKQVKGLGQFDRVYGQVGKFEQSISSIAGYVLSSAFTGIRKDGRREIFNGYVKGSSTSAFALYWLEGEDPIISEDAYIETEFYHLPYLPAEDPTCACKNVVWRFADKEIHFIGKWGSRRFSAAPLDIKAGYSNSFGIWYEGKTPYEHALTHTFNESTIATIENLRNFGYKVFE